MDPSVTSYSSHSLRAQPQEPLSSKTTTTKGRFFVLLVTLAASTLLLSFIFYSILVGHSRWSVYLLQVCQGVALLEKSWWHYRIRERFLTPLETAVTSIFGHGDLERPRLARTQYERELLERMEPKTYAIARFTDRWMNDVRGAELTVALVAASAAAGVSSIIAAYVESTVVTCAAVGTFVAVASACFAPTPSDGVAILIHEGTLTVTAMSTMIAHYTGSQTEMAILDYLFVALSGWIIIIISRIVATKKVLECFLMATLDTVAMLHVTVIMVEVVDFVEHPLASNLPREFAAFFVTVASAELGHFLFDVVTTQRRARCFRRWTLSGVADFITSILFGTAGMLVWMLRIAPTGMNAWNIIALVGAAALSQLGRSFMTLIHETALAPPWNRTTFTIWNNGIMELMNPFLIGWIVFHPYAKSILEGADSY